MLSLILTITLFLILIAVAIFDTITAAGPWVYWAIQAGEGGHAGYTVLAKPHPERYISHVW